MSLSPGTRLGPYEVIESLGAGGMGEVYRGTDTRLGREVAIKVLPSTAAASPAALARFEREGRAIAALNHPNICTLFDVGTDEGRPYLVMELLAGHTLHEVLASGPLPISAIIDHSIALADALHTAHARGIIHRDLKPANVFLTESGAVKILDFGLAKDADPADDARTVDRALTGPGTTLGTLSYMSPEQLRGDAVDTRTDLFSLGVVLYEMATGRRAFGGKTGAEVSAAILHENPARPRSLRPDITDKLEEIILKGLEKDRDLRYQSAAELRGDLKRLKRGDHSDVPSARSAPSVVSTPPASSSDAALAVGLARRHPMAIAAIAVIAIAAAATAWWVTRPRQTPAAPAPEVTMQPLTLDGQAGHATISPDGRFIAYVRRSGAESSVVVKQLTSNSDVVILPPSTGVIYDAPTVTPDGGFVDVLVRQRDDLGRGTILRIPFLGGPARRLLEGPSSGIGWSPDGKQMAFITAQRTSGPSTSVVVADAEGQNQRVLATRRAPPVFISVQNNSGNGPPSRPSWSPDGRYIAVGALKLPAENLREAGELIEFEAATGAERSLRRGIGFVGELSYLTADSLLIATRGVDNSEVSQWRLLPRTGLPLALTQGLNGLEGIQLTADRKSGVATQTINRSSIAVGALADGSFHEVVAESGAQSEFAALDAGGNLFFSARTPTGFAAFRRAGNDAAQVAADLLMSIPSPDGKLVVGLRNGVGLVRANADGSGVSVIVPQALAFPNAFTRDGAGVVYVSNASGPQQPWLVPIAGGEPRRLSDKWIANARVWLSRDGREVIFITRGGADTQTEICAFPAFDQCRALKVIAGPISADGKTLFAVDPKDPRNIIAQPIDGGAPTPVTRYSDKEIVDFSLSPDGLRMAITRGSRMSDVVLIKGLQ